MSRTLLIIHFGDQMCTQRATCVQSAIDTYNGFLPQYITDNNVEAWMESLLLRLGLAQEPRIWDRTTLMGRVLSSDWLRAYILSVQPCTLYTDTDVLHLKRFEFDDFSRIPYIMGVPADSAMMYSASACEYWANLINEKVRRQDWGNPQDAMNGDDGIPVTREYFRHYGASENHHLAEDKHWWDKQQTGGHNGNQLHK